MAHEAISDGFFRDIVEEHAPVRQLGTGFTFTEGPLWHPVNGNLIFSDMPADTRRQWTPGQGVAVIQKPTNKANGMTYDAELNLLVCEHSTSSVARIAPDGTRTVLCSHYQGRELNSPNDIVVGNDGAIWFTDPTYGRREHFGVPRPLQLGFQGVYRLAPGHVPGDEPELVVDRYLFSQPNGLTFSPCQRWMWVNDTEQANIRLFDVTAKGLENGRLFAGGIQDRLKPGLPDGMKADKDGNIYVTAPGGVWVYSFHGELIGKINCPEMVANLHWGGDDWSTLFLCATSSLYSVQTLTRGRDEPFMYPRATPRRAAAAPAPTPALSPAPSSGWVAAPALNLRPRLDARIDPARTALILQDLQNDVIIDGGAFAASGAPDHARAQNVVANAARLAEVARRRGIMVLHVWMLIEPGAPYLAQHAELMKGLKRENALVRGTWGAAPADGLAPQAGDLVVEKMSMSAWETSRLEAYLRHGGRDTIINCGAWTNMSVEHTARTGADKGFHMIVPQDACSTMNADWHQASINYAMQNVATVTTTQAVIDALG
ncbi:isochorismatase family protein [Aurantimonas coralicida]|uniref:isochorismatase family protein n=1 Tax=Aurantimonas coralicida TaxID=182270 RepID=UPI001D19120D|nr:isochorismatase family protein [Aurantimonas coralicida]MCC4299673.1 isochorismatase family protein [Aurantimonas coralicida]